MDSKKAVEFSSRTMLNILRHGANIFASDQSELGISSAQVAHIPISTKRKFIDQIISRHGREQLLLLGEGVKKMLHEPTVALLVHRSNPQVLLERWQRLEQYIHSSHTINVTWLGKQKFSLKHIAHPDKEPPSMSEDLVVLGVLMTLLNVVGARGIRLYADNSTSPIFEYESREKAVSLPQVLPAEWIIEWSSTGNMMILRDTMDKETILNEFPDWPRFAHETANAIISTSVLTPRVDHVACYMNLSRRTLQRRLRDINISFSKIVVETKVRIAAAWLVNSSLTMAEIGFISGFSDQPHFNRTFKKLIGVPPKNFQSFISQRELQ